MRTTAEKLMSFVKKSLLKDEKVLYLTGKHWIIFFIPAVWGLITAGFLVTPNNLVNKISLIPALIAILTGFNQWLIYITAEFAVTNRRIIMREGFFFRHMFELRLSTVSNMQLNQSLIGQIIGYGTVIISPFGGTEDVYSEINNPQSFQKAAQEQLDCVTQNKQIST